MSYLHLNRINAHFSPVLDDGQEERTSTGRKNKLTVGQMGILNQIAYAINNKDTFPISEKFLRERTGATNQTIATAIKRFLALGLLTRERSSARKPYLYKLALRCPPGCEMLDKHNSEKELKALFGASSSQGSRLGNYSTSKSEPPSDESTESPSHQGVSPLVVRAPIKNNRKINKELSANSCFTCKGKSETILGKAQYIHRDGCSSLGKKMSGQGWEIAVDRYGGNWNELSLEDQQREYHKDIADMKERKSSEDRKQEIAEEKTLDRVRELVPDSVLPNWIKFLALKYDKRLGIQEQLKNLAIRKSEQGIDLITGGSWELGAYPQQGDSYAALANS
ncbi:MAG: helix-turn-helix domain-containing protein [Aquiluna sp.]|nr:helix-turn-helix domain-containing protein [Aquiluna sp.]